MLLLLAVIILLLSIGLKFASREKYFLFLDIHFIDYIKYDIFVYVQYSLSSLFIYVSKTDGNSDLSSWKFDLKLFFIFQFNFWGQFVMECSSAKIFAIPNWYGLSTLCTHTRDQMRNKRKLPFNSHFWFPPSLHSHSACHQIIIFSSHECGAIGCTQSHDFTSYLFNLFIQIFDTLCPHSCTYNDLNENILNISTTVFLFLFHLGRICSLALRNSWEISTKTPNFFQLSNKIFSH